MRESDPYLILKMEFPGIKDVITKYKSSGLIDNYLTLMEQALSRNSESQVLYCLGNICGWYNENISIINSNRYVFNKSEHIKAKALLDTLNEQLQSYDFSLIPEKIKSNAETENKLRARQNVVFEHGLFIGSLGRKNVCALVTEDVEKPGDIDGIVYIPMDSAGAWKMQLCSNMRAAGLDIDLNRLI